MTKTKPQDIRHPIYLKIWEALVRLDYPCCLICYAPENRDSSIHKAFADSRFGIGICHDPIAAWNIVDNGYKGYPGNISIYVSTPSDLQKLRY